MDTWAQARGEATVDDVMRAIGPWLGDADGFTITGGEPFDQPAALKMLLERIRLVHSGDILVYSGHPLETLDLNRLKGLIDAVVSDPFQLEAAQTLALRGSDNQRLTLLTALGRERIGPWDRRTEPTDRSLDIMFDQTSGEIFLAGIPRRDDLRRLADLLSTQGHAVTTTEDRRRNP
jgi:anaerobic ribonucleoside-triphosphate reductase activating protein